MWIVARRAGALDHGRHDVRRGRGGDADAAKLKSAFAGVDRLFAQFVAESHVPGAAWGIVIDGTLAHAGAAGTRDLASKALDADTVFRIASMTKRFTAMSFLKLRDEGKLSLDDPYEYSNDGFAILGRIVARVSGASYADYVRANILRPPQMTATTLEPSSVPADRLAHGYRWEDATWKEEPQLANGSFGSMGGMLTSIHDLGRYWLRSSRRGRRGTDRRPDRSAVRRSVRCRSRGELDGSATRDAASGALQLTAGGYGFGLGTSRPARTATSSPGGLPRIRVDHAGGCRNTGVGIIAFGNLTYTSWSRVVGSAFERLAKRAACSRGCRSPRPRSWARATLCRSW